MLPRINLGLFCFAIIISLTSVVSTLLAQSQEGVVVDHTLPLGDNYTVYLKTLTDGNTEACLQVLPNQAGAEADQTCSVAFLAAQNLEMAGSDTSNPNWTDWNVRMVFPGPDQHCLITVPNTPGPEPLIHCMF